MIRLAGGLVFLAGLGSLSWLLMARPLPGTAKPGAAEPPMRDAFASDRDGTFDATRALKYLQAICELGPRVSGTVGMQKQQELLRKHFEVHGGKVELQRFQAQQKSRRQPTDMANLIVSWFPERTRRVILCSHYDTRPIADQEPERSKWQQPFISANDGGSGVAFLMEMAHAMNNLKTEVGVDFVLFDGEEYIFNPAAGADLYFFGSEHFARVYRGAGPSRRYVAAVLLDMIAGKEPQFPVEQNSWFKAGALAQELWQIAGAQRCLAFRNELGPEVRDDHLALNRAGIPAVDIIDFNYPHWHRLSDVPANCSGDGLAQVSRVLTAWLSQAR
jgi:hypothetical protein